ncbi:hypothetical protein [Falsibacillus pallidus]|uniref:PH (Pleckstrin Homology) domain-containing protein n=1 Tax=Falsibacillus pallidus TaxID=493781 RepID=A0A370GP28_9BACI|nr:hypothetical protein [Falsibacillus pallidus]RDI45488.1 hypothetical protein DFR59_102116 [Falsibacillus pallidus]
MGKQMIYSAELKRLPLFTTLILLCIQSMLIDVDITGFMFDIAVAILAAILLLIDFELEITNEKIIYRVKFLLGIIYCRSLTSSDIKIIKCKRTGWASKCISICPLKGTKLRIIRFKPAGVYDALVSFAEINNIAVEKSKDYQILER